MDEFEPVLPPPPPLNRHHRSQSTARPRIAAVFVLDSPPLPLPSDYIDADRKTND
jgi:hypothetical protein